MDHPYRKAAAKNVEEEIDPAILRSGRWELHGVHIRWDDNSGFIEIGIDSPPGIPTNWERLSVEDAAKVQQALTAAIGLAIPYIVKDRKKP